MKINRLHPVVQQLCSTLAVGGPFRNSYRL